MQMFSTLALFVCPVAYARFESDSAIAFLCHLGTFFWTLWKMFCVEREGIVMGLYELWPLTFVVQMQRVARTYKSLKFIHWLFKEMAVSLIPGLRDGHITFTTSHVYISRSSVHIHNLYIFLKSACKLFKSKFFWFDKINFYKD